LALARVSSPFLQIEDIPHLVSGVDEFVKWLRSVWGKQLIHFKDRGRIALLQACMNNTTALVYFRFRHILNGDSDSSKLVFGESGKETVTAESHEARKMIRSNSFASLVFVCIAAAGVGAALLQFGTLSSGYGLAITVGTLFLALVVSSSIKVADQWERTVVLRLGKFLDLKGPGLFFIMPILDKVPFWIDTRVITSSFKAEKTLTKDTVPVDVDAVLFWKVVDPKKAALDVADYQSAISWASQTALRDVIGKTMLSDMLEGRDKISKVLQTIIDERTEPWGINVISVEVKDVLIPSALEDAMSMQAQAERERQARVILGDSERQVAEKFGEAAKTYIDNPVALHLRAMNMLYEGLKENSTIVIVPSSAVNTMELGGFAQIAAMTEALGKNKNGNTIAPEVRIDRH
jgi:regulator of protease activity HflC (stomatin/prohibitin superfamily)